MAGHGAGVSPLHRTCQGSLGAVVQDVVEVGPHERGQGCQRLRLGKAAASQQVHAHLDQGAHEVAGHRAGRMIAGLARAGQLPHLCAQTGQRLRPPVQVGANALDAEKSTRQLPPSNVLVAHRKQRVDRIEFGAKLLRPRKRFLGRDRAAAMTKLFSCQVELPQFLIHCGDGSIGNGQKNRVTGPDQRLKGRKLSRAGSFCSFLGRVSVPTVIAGHRKAAVGKELPQ